jgi:hypothetical protein
MRLISTVAHATALIWVAELAETFAVSRRRVVMCVLMAVIALFGLSAALGATTVSTLAGRVPRAIGALIIETAASGALLSSALITVVLAMTAPTRSSLDHLLCLLPVTTSARTAGTQLPLATISMIGSFALCIPAMLVAGRVLAPGEALRYGCVLVASSILVQALAQCLLHAVGAVAQSQLRISAAVSSTVSGAATIASALIVFGPGVLSPAGDKTGAGPATTLPGLVSDIAVNRRPELSLPIFVGCLVVTIALVCLMSAIPVRKAVPPGVAFFPSDRILRGVRGTYIAHLLVMVRTPQTPTAVAGADLLLAGVAWALPAAAPTELRDGLAMAAPSAGCALVLFGPGRILPWAWAGSALGHHHTWWLTPVVVTHASFAALVWFGFSGAALSLGVIQPDDLVEMSVRAVVLFGSAWLAGLLIPWSAAQPLSGSIALLLATGLYLGCSMLVMYVSQDGELLGLLVSASLAGLLTVLSSGIGRRLASPR